jgi:hypothetical protein
MPPDLDDATTAIIERVRPYTMTPPDRVAALCEAVRYLVRARLRGAIVECGVWRDDYGLFRGARDAVDECLAGTDVQLLLNRVDFAARVAVVRKGLRR